MGAALLAPIAGWPLVMETKQEATNCSKHLHIKKLQLPPAGGGRGEQGGRRAAEGHPVLAGGLGPQFSQRGSGQESISNLVGVQRGGPIYKWC